MSQVDEYLSRAARDDAGKVVFGRVQSQAGQWFVMPFDPDGAPLAAWGPPDTHLADDAFRDEQGNVLMGMVFMHNGSVMTTPLDASLRPTISVAALVSKEGGTTSANPGGWPLSDEELDRTEPPPDPSDRPEWERQALAGVARDDLGQPLTTRVRAADGGWADVLMTKAEVPLVTEIDFGLVAGGEPTGVLQRATMMRGLGALVLVALDDADRPVLSAAAVREQGEKR